MLLTVSKPLESHKLKHVLINLMSRGPEGTHSMRLFELVELMRPISCMIKFMIFLKWPLIDECKQFVAGIHAFDSCQDEGFILHAYPISAHINMHAMKHLLCIKVHNKIC